MKKILFSLLTLTAALITQAADKVERVTSPNGKLKVEVCFGTELKYTVYDEGKALLKDLRILS